MTNILRPIARRILRYLSILTIDKHNPTIVAIVGDGQTSIAREVIYTVLKEKYPAIRRNLEYPEAEFSVPLTILGYPKYPKNYLEWTFALSKIILQTLILKPHKHYLILELSAVNEEIQNYWLDTTNPQTIIKIDYEQHSKKYLEPFFIKAKNVGFKYGLSEKEIKNALNKFTLPPSRIRLLKGKNKSLIIDSSYYYYPVKLNSIIEIANSLKGRKVAFVEGKEKIIIKKYNFIVNPKNYDQKSNDIIVVRGQRVKMYETLKKLIG